MTIALQRGVLVAAVLVAAPCGATAQNQPFGYGRFTRGYAFGAEWTTSYAVPAGDLDGDGDLDVVVGNDRAPGLGESRMPCYFVVDSPPLTPELNRSHTMRRIPSVLALLLSGCLVGCMPDREDAATNATHKQEIIETLAQQGRHFSEAYVRGDVEAMTNLYTDDAAIFPTNTDVIRGRDAIEQYWTLPPGRRITLHRMTPLEVRVEGSMAYDFGYYEVSGVNGEAAWGPTYGKYLVVWKQGDDGTWRMHLDMWNGRPAPPASD